MKTSRTFSLVSCMFLSLFLLLGPAAGPGPLFAQSSTIVTDEDALFGENAPDTLAPVPAPAGGAADAASPVSPAAPGSGSSVTAAFLKSDQVRIGGSFTGKLGTSFSWTNPYEGNHDPLSPDSSSLDPTIASTIFFNARPEEDLRIYGSVKTAWPFTNTDTVLTSAKYVSVPSPSVSTTSANLSTINLQVFELFSDFTWNDRVYFRFGKHTVKWGVGYFFSPADVLNLTPIDVTDPTAQREGPISLRALVPIPGTQDNLWGYILLPGSSSSGSFKPEDLAYAGKAEFLLTGSEIGLGGFYQKDKAPRLIATASGSLRRFDLFAEAVASWGNDRQYLTALTPSPAFESRDDRWYFQGTAGFIYTARDGYTSLAAQYYYNGEGYPYDERKDLVDQFNGLSQTIQENLSPILIGALYGASQHYGALSVSRSELFIKDLSASVTLFANLADLSGFITPTLQYKVFKYMNLSLAPSFVWYIDGLWGTGKNSEYVLLNKGPKVTISLTAGLGSSRF
jgi:hypothetical protein